MAKKKKKPIPRVRLSKNPDLYRTMGLDPQTGKPETVQGRPTDYSPEYAFQARKLCQLGATDFDLAEFFDVSTVTIWNWRNRYSEFFKSVCDGKGNADDRVQRSLYQKAVGYTVDIVEAKVLHNGTLVQYPVTKHYPPDTEACRIWLKNRRPADWRDKQVHEHTGTVEFAGARDKLEAHLLALSTRIDPQGKVVH